MTVHTGAETIQGRKIFKGGNYLWKYSRLIIDANLFVVQGLDYSCKSICSTRSFEGAGFNCISVIFWGCTCTPCTPMFRRHYGVKSNGWVWVQNCKVIVLKQRFSRTLDILAV